MRNYTIGANHFLFGDTIGFHRDPITQTNESFAKVKLSKYHLYADVPCVLRTDAPHNNACPPIATVLYDRQFRRPIDIATVDVPVYHVQTDNGIVDVQIGTHEIEPNRSTVSPMRCTGCGDDQKTEAEYGVHWESCPSIRRYVTIYIYPTDTTKWHCNASPYLGRHVRDPLCHDLVSIGDVGRGMTSSWSALNRATNRGDLVNTYVCLRFCQTKQLVDRKVSVPDEQKKNTLAKTVNETGIINMDSARAFLCTLREVPVGEGLFLTYESSYWNHPSVRFRNRDLRPRLSVLQACDSNWTDGRTTTFVDNFANQGFAVARKVFEEPACRAMDQVLGCLEQECRDRLRRTTGDDVSNLAHYVHQTTGLVDAKYYDLVTRSNGLRLDIMHPSLVHFSDFAPWIGAVGTMFDTGTPPVFVGGGLFRLYPSVDGRQKWHIDTDTTTPSHLNTVMVVVCLTDTPRTRGPTEVLSMDTPARASTDNPGFHVDDTVRDVYVSQHKDRKCFLTMKRGDVFVLGSRVLHRGTPNTSKVQRDWLYFIYGRDTCSRFREKYYEGNKRLFYDY
jgi:hypothetical protein